MAAFDIVSLDTATPQLEVPQTGDTYNAPRAIAIAPEGLTGNAATTSLDVTQTWNTSGTPTAVKLNVTDTASNAASLLMDLQVGGVSKASVTKSGRIAANRGYTYAEPQFYDASIGSGAGFQITGENNCSIYGGGNALFSVDSGVSAGIRINGTTSLGWVNGHAIANVADVRLFRDAAATLAQRDGTNAQTFRLYNTYTDASNYELGALSWAANELYLQTAAAGTGTNRNIVIRTGGGIKFQTSSADRWQINASGHFITATDNAYDIGASGATRPRDVYVARAARIAQATAIPAGGTQSVGVMVSSTADFGVFFGSGAPTLTAAKGSLYLRSDGSTTNDRMYVNTDGSTTWTAVTTAA